MRLVLGIESMDISSRLFGAAGSGDGFGMRVGVSVVGIGVGFGIGIVWMVVGGRDAGYV